MKKMKKYAIFCCTISLVFSLALGITGWFLAGSYPSQPSNDILAFFFRFFFITTPGLGILTLMAIARIKSKE